MIAEALTASQAGLSLPLSLPGGNRSTRFREANMGRHKQLTINRFQYFHYFRRDSGNANGIPKIVLDLSLKNLKMSESEYKKLVLADYDRQMKEESLPSNLLVPTPASIKAEVVKICEQDSDLSAGDEKILRSFVGKKDNVAAYRNAFSISKADPFRPLVNLFDDRSIKTNIRNIDLLALLIDFNPRPYHPNLPITNIIDPPTKPVEPVNPPIGPVGINPPLKRSFNKQWLVLASILFFSLCAYLVWKNGFKHYSGHEDCMIWNDDHYEPIECNDRSTAAPHYPIKRELVDNFKRITKPDTLTYQSIRKVWYSNYKGRMEFYTGSGPNPLDTTRRVLPMTTHILEKYVLHITN